MNISKKATKQIIDNYNESLSSCKDASEQASLLTNIEVNLMSNGVGPQCGIIKMKNVMDRNCESGDIGMTETVKVSREELCWKCNVCFELELHPFSHV